MADSLLIYEVEERRTEEPLEMITLYHRTYDLPEGETSILPGRGDAVDLDGVSGSGIMTPRVMGMPRRPTPGETGTRFEITFYQVRPYSGTPDGNGTELNGSRRTWEDKAMKGGMRVFATNDGTTDVPAIGAAFVTRAAATESGLAGRTCVEVTEDTQSLPGLVLHQARYQARKAR